MEEIIGKIEGKEITSGIGPTGNEWIRCAFKINGQKYSTFDKKIMDNHGINDVVKMGGKQGDKYWDMLSMEKTVETPAPVENAQPQAPKSQYDKAIARGDNMIADNETNDILRQILAEMRK